MVGREGQRACMSAPDPLKRPQAVAAVYLPAAAVALAD
jgi:hypothetical protein